jgi:hypothetical protein
MNAWAGPTSFRSIRLALETRLMLDAATLPAAAAAAPGGAPSEADPRPAEAARPRSEVVFAFSDVSAWQDIVATAPAGTRIERIGAEEDGLARMADVLRTLSDVDAVHVIGHGGAGTLDFGAVSVDAGTLSAHSDDLRTIGAALTADADLLFYGCESGAGGSGLALAQALAQATGADVALSSDLTGSVGQGGDWDLETRTGTIETATLSAPGWDGLLAQTTTTVDVSSAGGAANGASGAVAVSSDGRYLAFTSSATNLVAGDTNGQADVFLRDTQLGTTIRVSVNTPGVQATGGSSTVSDISDDGRYVVFSSTATNLVAGDTNGVEDVFVRDTQLGTTTRVSISAAGAQANGASTGGSIAVDGSRVAFISTATNLLGPPGDTNGQADAFVRQITGGPTTIRVSAAPGPAEGNGAASSAVISADGGTVAFVSTSSNLVAGDTNGVADVFVHTISTMTTQRVSVGAAGAQATAASSGPSLSTDGRYVTFATSSTLDVGDTNGTTDIYRRDRTGATTTLMSVGAAGAVGNGASSSGWISGGGDYVVFTSNASNLVSGDTNGVSDIFVRDIAKGQTLRVSVASSTGAEGNAASDNPTISSDGGQVAFRSAATNLAGTDANGVTDIFLASGFTITPADTGAGRNLATMPRGADVRPPAGPGFNPADGAPPPSPSLSASAFGEPNGALGLRAGLQGPIGAPAPAGPRSGGGESMGFGNSPAERMAMFGREGMSIAERRGLLQGLPNATIIDGLRASGDPAARAAAAVIEKVQSGETVTVADVKAALAAEGASQEETTAALLAFHQIDKTVRTQKLSGALSELARDPATADAFAKVATAPLRDITLSGNRIALLIGVQNYQGGLPSLATPAADVAAMSQVLAERFGYQTIVANDASKADIVEMIRAVGERLDGQGSLMVYYAGHGYADESTGEGYWLPSGARTDSAAGWISTRDISNYLGQVKADQILVVSDSCYSGAMTRQMRLSSDAVGEPREQIVSRRSVTALSSGGDEPVNDGGGNGHSVFAAKLLGVLGQADADSMGFQLFSQVRTEVTRAVPQEPTYGALEAAGHAGRTDFVIGGR